MHVGSKGWYVQKLKENGVNTIQGRKVEKYKKHILANLLAEKE
ncbi:YflJ family protein [Thalassobacillus hwangdonensis]|uniref:YflJ family protein n=1 Tax=Thalassobacillus hwangdonensis TaxID=546108 RepID=A0ABW3L6G8_9BACI